MEFARDRLDALFAKGEHSRYAAGNAARRADADPIHWVRVGVEARATLPFWPLTGVGEEYLPDLQPKVSVSLFVGGAFQL